MKMAPTTRPTWITGAGVISCAGANPHELWTSVAQGRVGLENGLGSIDIFSPDISPEHKSFHLSLHAAQQALHQAGWSHLQKDDGFIFATTTGQILTWEKAHAHFVRGDSNLDAFYKSFRTQHLGSLQDSLAMKIGFTPHRLLVATACTASTQALILAHLWLQQGRVRRCLVGGTEVLCDLTREGFKSLQLLASVPAQPFDQNRQGINLSEGSAFVCLETEPRATPLARLSGCGMSTDGFHMTSPHPEGAGTQKAVRQALQMAQLKPQQIDWIHAHGTGSVHNDLSEGLAFQAIFGKEGPYVTSTKGIHGHALGASGLIETVLGLEALQHQMIPRTFGLQTPDSKIPLRHALSSRPHPIRHILKNTLGFGGANAAIILSHSEAQP